MVKITSFFIKLDFEKIDNTNYSFYGLGPKKKAKYKYIVPNSIKNKINIFHTIYQVLCFASIIILLPISYKFKFQYFVCSGLLFSILIWIFVIYYLLRNCEKKLIKKP